jgi:hypothetical protein
MTEAAIYGDFTSENLPGRGLEPLRISPPDPKSGASANFATLAHISTLVDVVQILAQLTNTKVCLLAQIALGAHDLHLCAVLVWHTTQA